MPDACLQAVNDDACLQAVNDAALSLPPSGQHFSALAELHLPNSTFEADGAALLSAAVAAAGRVLRHLNLRATDIAELDFLVGCQSLRILDLSSAPPSLPDTSILPCLSYMQPCPPQLCWDCRSDCREHHNGTVWMQPQPSACLAAGTLAAAEQLENLRWLTALEELHLAGTAADTTTVQAVCGLPRLRSLCLSETAVTDESLPHLAALQGPLADLALCSLPISGEGLSAHCWGEASPACGFILSLRCTRHSVCFDFDGDGYMRRRGAAQPDQAHPHEHTDQRQGRLAACSAGTDPPHAGHRQQAAVAFCLSQVRVGSPPVCASNGAACMSCAALLTLWRAHHAGTSPVWRLSILQTAR